GPLRLGRGLARSEPRREKRGGAAGFTWMGVFVSRSTAGRAGWASKTSRHRPHSTLKLAAAPATPSCSEKRAWHRWQRISIGSALGGVGLVQPEGSMQRAHRQLRVFFVDETGDLDLGGADHPDVHAFVREHLEHL